MQKVDVFSNRSFLGQFVLDDLLIGRKLISTGTILFLNEKKYCVDNIILKGENTISIEVS